MLHQAQFDHHSHEVDPLLCPKCGGTMKVIAFIEKRDQADVIERILKHRGQWGRPASRAPLARPVRDRARPGTPTWTTTPSSVQFDIVTFLDYNLTVGGKAISYSSIWDCAWRMRMG